MSLICADLEAIKCRRSAVSALSRLTTRIHFERQAQPAFVSEVFPSSDARTFWLQALISISACQSHTNKKCYDQQKSTHATLNTHTPELLSSAKQDSEFGAIMRLVEYSDKPPGHSTSNAWERRPAQRPTGFQSCHSATVTDYP